MSEMQYVIDHLSTTNEEKDQGIKTPERQTEY